MDARNRNEDTHAISIMKLRYLGYGGPEFGQVWVGVGVGGGGN